MAIYGLSKIDLLENLSIRATEDEIAQLFEIPKRLVRDYHFEWLFKKKFKTYDEVLEFVKEFERNYAHDREFKESMNHYDEKIANHDFLKTTKLEWTCSTLARMRRLCGGGYKLGCYSKHNF